LKEHTYSVLGAELLVKGGRHNLSSDVSGGIEVSLALNATRRRDHLDEYVLGDGRGRRGWWLVKRALLVTTTRTHTHTHTQLALLLLLLCCAVAPRCCLPVSFHPTWASEKIGQETFLSLSYLNDSRTELEASRSATAKVGAEKIWLQNHCPKFALDARHEVAVCCLEFSNRQTPVEMISQFNFEFHYPELVITKGLVYSTWPKENHGRAFCNLTKIMPIKITDSNPFVLARWRYRRASTTSTSHSLTSRRTLIARRQRSDLTAYSEPITVSFTPIGIPV
jgi:hypothetical protein